MCDIAPLQYTTKRSDLATCSMPSYESGRKNCANHAVFLCPVVGGGQHKASAADSWQDSGGEWCSGQQLSEPATADGLLLPCALLDAQSGLPHFYSKHSVVAGRATAITADSRSVHSLH